MGHTLRRWWNACREGLTWLPMLLVGILLFAALHDLDWKILLWREGYAVIVPLAFIGALCARSLNRAVSDTSLTSIRNARPGYVALRGQAQAIADHALSAPESGLACVWYHYSYKSDKHFTVHESRRPFRLQDETGEVLVMPADAEVTYGGGGDSTERRINPGDWLYVLGELRPSIETPLSFVEPDIQFGRVKFEGDSEADRQAAERKAEEWFQERAQAIPLPRLPSIVLPKDGGPFLISVEDKLEISSRYRFLLRFNLTIAIVGALLFPFTNYLVL